MKDQEKTRGQMINELAELRQRLAEMEVSDSLRKQVEQALRASSR